MSEADRMRYGSLYERIVRDLQTGSRESLTFFLQRFQHPMYAYLRARGLDHSRVADELREFVRRHLEVREESVAPDGRLRTHLRTCLAQFREQDHPTTNSIDPDEVVLDLEWSLNRWEEVARSGMGAADVFDHEWAAVILRDSRHVVERDYVHHRKAKEYRLLSRSLDAVGRRISHAELAHLLHLRESQAKQKLRQLSQRFRHALHQHVAETVAESEIAPEIEFISERTGAAL